MTIYYYGRRYYTPFQRFVRSSVRYIAGILIAGAILWPLAYLVARAIDIKFDNYCRLYPSALSCKEL